jgi:hypothetical protein
MISKIRAMRSARARDDSGMALLIVIVSMLILTITASAALAYAVGSLPLSRHDQDSNGALAAAQAGIDDYIRHLNQDDSYWQQTPPDCANQALVGPAQPAGCLHSATPGWAFVNDNGDLKGAAFHDDINVSGLGGNGSTLTVTATGRVNNVRRTLQAEVGRSGSTQFVYFTDYEVADPDNLVAYPNAEGPADCTEVHWWEGRSCANDCAEITFIGGDILTGPVHTNDTPLTTNAGGLQPEFKGYQYYPLSLESSDPACKNGTAANGYAGCYRNQTPKFDKPAGYAPVLKLDDNSDQMKTYPGCDYVGQTRIKFTGDGRMTVWSAETTAANSTTTATCGGTAPNGVSIPVPDAQVIYAGNASSTHQCKAQEISNDLPLAGDVNMVQPDQFCGNGNVYVEGRLTGRVTIAAQNSIIVTGDLTYTNPSGTDLLGLVAGNYVEVMHPWILTFSSTAGSCVSSGGSGPVAGQVWQGEDWNQAYNGTWTKTAGSWVKQPKDALGRAELWNPGTWTEPQGIWTWNDGNWFTPSASQSTANYGYKNGSFGNQCSTGMFWRGDTWNNDNGLPGPVTWPLRANGLDIQIYASIQTLQHSFYVQSYNKGAAQGKVIVVGSIAQKYRGAVGTGNPISTGYVKSYSYDPRLHSRSPPYFPQWVGAAWSTVRLGEIPRAY